MVLRTLILTRQYIKKRGWIQGYSENPQGVCLYRAVHLACHQTRIPYRSVARALLPNNNLGLIAYNDTPGRTKRQVIRVINRAILRQIRTNITSFFRFS